MISPAKLVDMPNVDCVKSQATVHRPRKSKLHHQSLIILTQPTVWYSAVPMLIVVVLTSVVTMDVQMFAIACLVDHRFPFNHHLINSNLDHLNIVLNHNHNLNLDPDHHDLMNITKIIVMFIIILTRTIKFMMKTWMVV